MSTAKDQIRQILESQPEDSSYDEIVREIAFRRMVQKGLEDMASEKVISNEEMHQRIKTWQK